MFSIFNLIWIYKDSPIDTKSKLQFRFYYHISEKISFQKIKNVDLSLFSHLSKSLWYVASYGHVVFYLWSFLIQRLTFWIMTALYNFSSIAPKKKHFYVLISFIMWRKQTEWKPGIEFKSLFAIFNTCYCYASSSVLFTFLPFTKTLI